MSTVPDYLESIVATRQGVIDEIRELGGIDFKELCAKPQDARGNVVDFKLLGGFTFKGINLGFKQFKHLARWELDGFAEEVATLRHIGSQGSQYSAMLPRIHYEVRDDSDTPLGILTEDFTVGGCKRKVAEIPLYGLAAMFSDPKIVDDDNAHGILGRFQENDATGMDGRTDHVIDVTPLYATHRFNTQYGELPDWLSEEIRVPEVATRLSELRISISELAS